ncbi:PHB depolymerase family esterase [soil metagenome]
MNKHFAAAMRQAALSTRALDVNEATKLIQDALGVPVNTPAPKNTLGPGALTRARQPLGAVVKTLHALRQKAPAGRRPQVPIPDGAQFLLRNFAAAAGMRRYKLYIPAASRPRGLIVMLHGCTQNPDDFAAGTNMNAVAERHGLLVAYPEQSQAANTSACWNWFNPADQLRDAGEPSIIAGMARHLQAEFSFDRSHSFVAGLSAGGAMAAVMSETYPDVFAAAGIHSGLAFNSAYDVMSAFAAMRGDIPLQPAAKPQPIERGASRARIIVFHGSADETVSPSNAARIVAAAKSHLGRGLVARTMRFSMNGRNGEQTLIDDLDGRPVIESWLVEGAGHAWSGGQADGSYTDPMGPDASGEFVRFFLG